MGNTAKTESEERIKTFEEHYWKGIESGIKATKNQVTIPEVIDVMTRYLYQYNKKNLNFTRSEVQKESVNIGNKLRKLKNQGK